MSLERLCLVAQADVADQVDELTQALLVEAGPGVVLGEHSLERGVVALDGRPWRRPRACRCGLLGVGLEVRPAGFLGHPEDVVGAVFVRGLRGRRPGLLGGSSSACCSSKASEMYLRKMRPRTTCLYSAASMLERSASAACHNWASYSMGPLFFLEALGFRAPANLARFLTAAKGPREPSDGQD